MDSNLKIKEKDLRSFLDSINFFPECRKIEYFKLKNKMDQNIKYFPVDSKKQISYVIRKIKNQIGSGEYQILLALLSKFIYMKDYDELVDYIINNDHNDLEIYL